MWMCMCVGVGVVWVCEKSVVRNVLVCDIVWVCGSVWALISVVVGVSVCACGFCRGMSVHGSLAVCEGCYFNFPGCGCILLQSVRK